MYNLAPLQPIDYLLIGHLACDITPQGLRLGGSATYSTLTALALGLRVGVVTAWAAEIPLGPLSQVPIVSYPAEHSTTFKNIYTPEGRLQYVHNIAPSLDFHLIPEPWRQAPIVHLAPIAQEVEPSLVRRFPSAMVGLTPQGWLRGWDEQGRISPAEWPEATYILQQAGVAIISTEDVDFSETRIEEMASSSRILVVTENSEGARIYWNGDVRRYRPPRVNVVDMTGAGDIFAAAFLYRLFMTRDPWEACRFATTLASFSVTRPGLDGIPTPAEIQECLVEVF